MEIKEILSLLIYHPFLLLGIACFFVCIIFLLLAFIKIKTKKGNIDIKQQHKNRTKKEIVIISIIFFALCLIFIFIDKISSKTANPPKEPIKPPVTAPTITPIIKKTAQPKKPGTQTPTPVSPTSSEQVQSISEFSIHVIIKNKSSTPIDYKDLIVYINTESLQYPVKESGDVLFIIKGKPGQIVRIIVKNKTSGRMETGSCVLPARNPLIIEF